MATDKDASCPTCSSDPNFAVICSFLNKFAGQCGIAFPTFAELQDMLEDTQEVSQVLIDMHVKLLRKARKSFTADKWEKALAKFCHTYSQQDGWELERFGYKKARLGVKVKLLKVLLETQFDVNAKFKTEVNKLTPSDLRLEPLGRDETGLTYWCQFDTSSHVRVYREDVDDETWELVAKDRDGLVQLIDSLSSGEGQRELNNILNEDSTSQEIEKPITDTGQEVENRDPEGNGKDENEEGDGLEEGDENGLEEGERNSLEEAGGDGLEEAKGEGLEEAKGKVLEEAKGNVLEESKGNGVKDAKDDENLDEEEIEEEEEVQEEEVEEEEDDDEEDEQEEEEEEEVCGKKEQRESHTSVVRMDNKLLITKNNNDPPKASAVGNGITHSSDVSQNNSSGVDLSLKSEPRRSFTNSQQGNFYMIPDRHPMPERADILSQMSARFNEKKEAEDLSLNLSKKTKPMQEPEQIEISNPTKKIKLVEDDQPIMLVKRDMKLPEQCDEPISLASESTKESMYDSEDEYSAEPEVSEAIEEPVQHISGPGSGAECDVGNPMRHSCLKPPEARKSHKYPSFVEPEFSEVIEEPVQYIVGLGSGAECDVGNPKRFKENTALKVNSSINQSQYSFDPEFSEVIEEPVQYFSGFGSGAECDVKNPKRPEENTQTAIVKKNDQFENLPEPEFSEVIEEDIQFVVGLGSGVECNVGNPKRHKTTPSEVDSRIDQSQTLAEPEFSEVIEEPVQYFVGCGSGADCDVGNPKRFPHDIPSDGSRSHQSQNLLVPEFSPAIEEPVQYVKGAGSGADCGVGSPRHVKDDSVPSSSSTIATMGIECSLSNLTLQPYEPNFSDVIEEPVMFVQGSGYGQDCLTGNLEDKEESSVEDNPLEKKSKLWDINSKCGTEKQGSEDNQVVPPSENLQNSVHSSISVSSNIDMEESKKETSGKSSDPEPSSETKSTDGSIAVNDDSSGTEGSTVCKDLSAVVENCSPHKDSTHNDQSCSDKTLKQENNSEGDRHSSCSDSSQTLKHCETTPVPESRLCPEKDVKSTSLSDSDGKISKSQPKDDEKCSDDEKDLNDKTHKKTSETALTNCSTESSEPFDGSNPKTNSMPSKRSARTSSRIKSKGEESENINLDEKKENDLISTQSLKNKLSPTDVINENGPLTLKIMDNCTVNLEKLNSTDGLKSSCKKLEKCDTTKVTNNDEILDKKTDANSVDLTSDKKSIPRRNVMLSNIIEVCLDNHNSKDDTRPELKEQINAKYNDLFSAKDLVNPPSKKEKIKDISKDEENSNCLPKVGTSNSDVAVKKENYEETVKCEKEECLDDKTNVKIENIKPDDSNRTVVDKELIQEETEKQVKIKDEPTINDEDGVKTEDKHLKQAPKGRKSRTNSSSNEKEVEIPNKIRKTEKAEPKPTRRSTRRGNRSNSQSGLNSVSEDENKKLENQETKSTQEEKVNSENQTSSDNTVKQADINTKSEKETKTDSPSAIEAPLDNGPTPEKSEVPRNQNRKRRSSMRISRSEEEGAEPQEEEKEAGGKKPRLRGKARRGKGRGVNAASRPPPEESSSDEDTKPTTETNEKDDEKDGQNQGKSKGRPPKRAVGRKKSAVPLPTPAESKKKQTGKTKKDKLDEETVKETKKQSPKKPTKSSKKASDENKKKNLTEVKRESDSESGCKKSKTAHGGKKGKKTASRVITKQRKPSKEEKPESPEEEDDNDGDEEEGGEDDEEEEEEEEEKKPKEGKAKAKVEKNKEVKVKEKDVNEDAEPEPQKEEKPTPKKNRMPKKKTLLGLMESDLIHSKPINADEEEGGRVRQSRRIAQIKIKEEAERRAIEEATMLSIKEMKKPKKEEKQPTPKKSKKKKGRSEMGSEEEDETFKEPVLDDKKRGRKKKKKKDRLKYDENRPWRSSSDSSSEEDEEEEEHFEEEDDEEDIRTKQLVSDHEFSPESDLEGGAEEESTTPVKRARTAKKDPVVADAEEEEPEQTEDYPCKKCGQPDHPEWILLCDKCDSGYHASCLRPPLMLIPEGDWFCPPCQHADLVNKLKETLRVFEKSTKKRENEELRRKRLAYVGISLANVLPTPEKGSRRPKSSSEYSSTEEESESSEEEEPVYQLRQRRTTFQTNYRFNDYDELINSAIQDEMEAVKGAGNMGRGKDIANIVEAEKAGDSVENAEDKENGPIAEEEEQGENWRPRVVPRNTALPSLRKKPKKLTNLDRASDDDDDSDEDFKGSSEEEEYSSTEGGDSGDSVAKVPVRRSSRNRISRIDKEFINDDSESSDEPRRKKTRRLYASSSSESSDTTWGRRKRKSKTYSRIRSSKGSKKKKKKFLDSDSDRPKFFKRSRPKNNVLSGSDSGDGLRRTRGKKVSYLDLAGSDTEEEVIRKSRKLPSEDEDEFIPEKEAEDEEEAEVEEDEDNRSDFNDDEEKEEDDQEEEKDDKEQSSADECSMQGINSPDNENCTRESFMLSSDDRSCTLDKISNLADQNSVDKNLNKPNKDSKEPDVVVEPVKTADVEDHKVSEGEDIEEEDEEDDDVEEEEIEEEIEEEVEEEEYEGEIDDKVEEAKNLALPKLRVVEPRELMRKEPEVERKVPPVTITVLKANPSAVNKELPPLPRPAPASIAPTPVAPIPPTAPPPSIPPLTPIPPTSVPTPVIKEEKKDEKEEKKEPVPTIRLVPSAKLLDPNKQRRVAEESVIRGMLSTGSYYRPQRIPQGPPPQYRQRYQEQQRYNMYQPPPPPPPPHQYYPTGGYYPGEDYGGYDEHMEQQVVGGGGDEDGVFSGLVSYFSSQREDNIDS